VQAAGRGEAPDPAPGIRAKQRSVHNTYFTLPVLFVMISNHFALTYNHAWNWLILVAFTLAGALIRVWFVARHKGRASPLPIAAAVAILAAVAVAIAPRAPAASSTAVGMAEIQPIIERRCTTCHSADPTFAAFPAPPAGVVLDTADQIREQAPRIHEQAVVLKVMPIGNLTHMTDHERALVDAWYRGIE
jgi:uncharacterized membrane protein